ncbi:MAG TPA: hypothetical protein VLA52_14125 [Thermohalobaculum sp.]|nr:hypothetical protein [Thermohalobaculum sp.]
MFGNGSNQSSLYELACNLKGNCTSGNFVTSFKKVASPGQNDSGSQDIQFGLHSVSTESIDQLMTLYWPAVLGVAIAFALVVFGKPEASRLAAGVAFVAQMALVAIAR